MPGCPQEWEELTADVFLCAWRERKKLQPGKVKSWLATVARNRALNRLRDRRELLPLEEDVLVLAQDSPQRELENREVAQLVRAALETLEPSDRELFVRHYYYGQTVEKAAEEIGVGVPTLQDLVQELVKPGRDVRDDLPAPILRTDVLDIKDLKPGMELTGTVRNVVDFGVFVDIGVHQDGLVHISQICDRFIKHPSQAVAVGDVVKVVVLEVDKKKQRISLSMRQAAGKK